MQGTDRSCSKLSTRLREPMNAGCTNQKNFQYRAVFSRRYHLELLQLKTNQGLAAKAIVACDFTLNSMSISHSPSSRALQCSENAIRLGWQHTVHILANYFKSTTKTDCSEKKQKRKPTSLKNTSAQWKCIQSLKSTDGNAGCNSCCFHICNLCSKVIWHIYRLNSFN